MLISLLQITLACDQDLLSYLVKKLGSITFWDQIIFDYAYVSDVPVTCLNLFNFGLDIRRERYFLTQLANTVL